MKCRSLSTENEQGYFSISRERYPDLIFEVNCESEGRKFAVLDSKYSCSKQRILEAMASAHIYRDSLRLGNTRAALSLILVPAMADEILPLSERTFWSEHGVGCFRAQDNGSMRQLVATLMEM